MKKEGINILDFGFGLEDDLDPLLGDTNTNTNNATGCSCSCPEEKKSEWWIFW